VPPNHQQLREPTITDEHVDEQRWIRTRPAFGKQPSAFGSMAPPVLLVGSLQILLHSILCTEEPVRILNHELRKYIA
jgi:hypothetical protein